MSYANTIARITRNSSYATSAYKSLVKTADAALMPYQVDRSKLYVMDRIGKSKILDSAIEFARFAGTTQGVCL